MCGSGYILQIFAGVQGVRRLIWEEVVGLLLILMVFLAAKYGTVQVVSAEVAERNGKPVVVIDSGHGGNDPGKVGVDGSLEKEINLEIAMKLKQYLELEDVEVIMTRESDVGLYQEGDTSKKMADMRNRCQLINDAKPDLVVSIHQNSYPDESVHGCQVFHRSDKESTALAGFIQNHCKRVLDPDNHRQPKENSRLGFSYLVNDNDGQGRKGGVQFASGIYYTKDSSLFTYINLIGKN